MSDNQTKSAEDETSDALKELEQELSSDAPVSADTSAAAAPVVRKKREGKRAPVQPQNRRGRIVQKLHDMRSQVSELVVSLTSPDDPTRRMSAYFFLSLAGMALVMGLAVDRYWKHTREQRLRADRIAKRESAVLEEFLRKRSEIARRKNSVISLGNFTVELHTEPGDRQPGSLNLAEIELTIECDSKEARDQLEEQMIQARNEVTNTFVSVDRHELMSLEGKARLKRTLRNRLNLVLHKGKVESVYFSRLLLN